MKGWETKTLGEVAQIINGGTPKSKVAEFWDGGIAWITPKDMGQSPRVYVSETNRTISNIGLQKSNVKLLNDLGAGTTFKELSTRNLAGIKIPIPPLAEQKRIVEILDKAFEGIDRAIANTQKKKNSLEELKTTPQALIEEVLIQKFDSMQKKNSNIPNV